jgi:hypothetical protein
MGVQPKVKLAEGLCDMGRKSGTMTAEPGAAPSGGSGAMGSLLSNMQSAGVDMTGGAAPDEETKQRLREMGIEVYKKGGKVSSASKRADGIATKGKTKGRIV